jgi:hypothetical protein
VEIQSVASTLFQRRYIQVFLSDLGELVMKGYGALAGSD